MTRTGKIKDGKKNAGKIETGKNDKYHNFEFIFLIVFISVLLLDQLTKHLVRNYLTRPIDLGVFSIVYTTNTGIAFSMLKNLPLIPMIVAALVVLVIFVKRKDLLSDKISSVGFGLVVAGAAGNLIDRFAFSRVTDFMDFHFWPVFNIADSALTIGAIILVIYFWKK